MNAYIYSRTHWSPAVISASASPYYPGRCPFIARNPCPTVRIIVIPTAIMKWSPSPTVIGNPCVAIVCHRPVAICGVGMKISSHSRYPYHTKFDGSNPSAIGRQFAIEYLKVEISIVIFVIIIPGIIIPVSVLVFLGRCLIR